MTPLASPPTGNTPGCSVGFCFPVTWRRLQGFTDRLAAGLGGDRGRGALVGGKDVAARRVPLSVAEAAATPCGETSVGIAVCAALPETAFQMSSSLPSWRNGSIRAWPTHSAEPGPPVSFEVCCRDQVVPEFGSLFAHGLIYHWGPPLPGSRVDSP